MYTIYKLCINNLLLLQLNLCSPLFNLIFTNLNTHDLYNNLSHGQNIKMYYLLLFWKKYLPLICELIITINNMVCIIDILFVRIEFSLRMGIEKQRLNFSKSRCWFLLCLCSRQMLLSHLTWLFWYECIYLSLDPTANQWSRLLS